MNRCVSEETLWQLYEGEGSREERAHLAKCQVCTIRYERLAKDITLLGQVLRESPPQTVAIKKHRSPVIRWVPIALAGATAVVLLWSQWQLPELPQLPRPKASTPSQIAAQAVDEKELAHFFTAVIGPAIFATADLGIRPLPKRATTGAYLQAALDGEWPHERCEGDRTQTCDSDPLAFLSDQDEG